jgi:putative addiction module CopG family antidote
MNVPLTPELERFVGGKVESGLHNNAAEVIREGVRLLKSISSGSDVRRSKLWRYMATVGPLQERSINPGDNWR